MNESVAMVPDAEQRLRAAFIDLRTFMVRFVVDILLTANCFAILEQNIIYGKHCVGAKHENITGRRGGR